MPSRAASAVMVSSLRQKVNESSVMVMVKVLGHLERVDYLAGPQPDGVLAAQRLTLTAGGRSDLVELGFGGGQQLAAFAGAFGGQGGVAAADQPLAGVVGVGDGHQVLLVEQRQLQRVGGPQGLALV